MTSINFQHLPPSFYDATTNTLLVDEATALKVQASVEAKLAELPDVAPEKFLQMIANLAPSDVDTDLKLGVTLGMFEAAATMLGDAGSEVVTFVGDLAKFLARVMIEQASDQRQNALQDRLNAREQAKGELMNQAGQMDKAADKMIAGATTALITGLVAAGVQMLASVVSLVGAAKALKSMETAHGQTKDVLALFEKGKMTENVSGMYLQASKQAFDIAGQKGAIFTALSQVGQAAGQGMSAVGSSEDTKAQAAAKKLEAEGSRDAAEAQELQQTADTKKQIEEALSDMMKQIINFLKEMREAEVDAMRSLTKV